MATRRITFRLYPNKTQEDKLHKARKLHKDLFNACLYHRKVEYEKFGRSVNYYDQQNILPLFKEYWVEYKELGSHALQATVKRVDFAYKRFFQKLGGRPKFKSSRDYRGWTYPCKAGWKASRKLRKKQAPNFKTRGATTEGTSATHPLKKVKASKRWRKAKDIVSRLQQKVTRVREDWQHKVAAQIVSRNSMVATEKLNLKGMTRKVKTSKGKKQKSGLNRSILDVGIGNLISLLKYKLEECQGIFVEVPTVKVAPSQTCPACGRKEKKDLSQRIHDCPCGCMLDRDVAAAQVMLAWALGTSVLSRGADSSTVVPANCGGFRQLAALRRQKPLPQPQGG
ncbi:MAG: hypothetical protein N4J56_002585 [Chroococcidiopsis sp. SAG 2025]|uniref:RNA-guided endonuclease InsQ/TnpB family protein n=1 Tax=Chroococcidiopsis sp. SAG 2025 TaxID=171389 RepID=UPI00293735B7|nr:transposase [Chroococcidiopsis sp. SAG 2025]MDV2992931.1 hypothetical protein [Chroococcidiopsis sp. SAG 2025]